LDLIQNVINIDFKLEIEKYLYNLKIKIMKKLFFVLAFVAVYGISMATTGTSVTIIDNVQQTIVANFDDDATIAFEGEKKEEKKAAKTEAKSTTETKAKGEGCGEAKSEAKSEGCAGEAKKDCASSCAGKKK